MAPAAGNLFVCVAVIDKNKSPLYIKTANPQDELKMSYIVHTALDVVDEKDFTDLYPGLLCPAEDYYVYGYVTNTKVKFIAVLAGQDGNSKMKNFFRKLHSLYVDMACNPFYIPSTPIKSPKFDAAVQALIDTF